MCLVIVVEHDIERVVFRHLTRDEMIKIQLVKSYHVVHVVDVTLIDPVEKQFLIRQFLSILFHLFIAEPSESKSEVDIRHYRVILFTHWTYILLPYVKPI